MFILVLLLPLFMISAKAQQSTDEESPLVVLAFKWVRDRQPLDNAVSVSVPPVAAVTANDKIFARQRRANDPAGMRDPNADSIDSRSAELDRIVQESREPEPVDGFAYQIKIQNGSSRITQTVFWEYQFTEKGNPANVTRRQFLCAVKMKPQESKDLRAFVLRGPSDVINVKNAGKMGDQFNEVAQVNRVEYVDGTFWQRKDWDLNQFKLTSKARVGSRGLPVCRSL